MMTKFTLGDASGQALAGKAHTNAVIALAVAGDMLVSCGLDDTLRAYSLASFSPAGDAVALGGAPSGLALAPDGSVCVVTTNKAILVLTRQGTGWAQASTTAITFGALGVAIAPNKTEVVVACDDNQLRVYALAGTALSPSPALTQHKSAVTCVGYSPCGRLLASADAGKEVRGFLLSAPCVHPVCQYVCVDVCARARAREPSVLACMRFIASRDVTGVACAHAPGYHLGRSLQGCQVERQHVPSIQNHLSRLGARLPTGSCPPLPLAPSLAALLCFPTQLSFLPSYVFRWPRLSRLRSL